MNLDALSGLSQEEREYVLRVLDDLSNGDSQSYNELVYSDFKEVPVSIDEFINNPIYLGRSLMDESGNSTVYPYWLKVLKDIFPDPFTVNYTTAIFTGGIGLGKSTIADIGVAYQLYKVLCLKDPYAYYGLQKIDVITFAFMNNTLDNARDVAWRKFQNMILLSEWFCNHGTINKMKKEPEWEPPEGIEMLAGSSANHIIGRAVFGCLDGDTVINTINGDYRIKELVGKNIQVFNTDDYGKLLPSKVCTVLPTTQTNIEYQLTLSDGTIIKCTPNHTFLMSNGEYLSAPDIRENDVLFSNSGVYVEEVRCIILNFNKQYYDVVNAGPYNNFRVKTNSSYIVSHNCFIDEINFSATSQDIQIQKKKALDLVTRTSMRMQSRFMKGEKNPTILFIASSKDDDQSFLESFIRTKKENESKSTLIVDEPQWVIRTDKDSPIKFKVALGNKFLNNELVPLNATKADVQSYIDKGYTLIDVPIGYYENFQDDLDRALKEIAGISTSGVSRYISGARILQIKNKSLKNAFTMDVIEVGNSPDDKAQYYDFFDMSRIPKDMMYKPLYIHLDMSLSGDKTGIAGTWIKGKKPHQEGLPDSKELFYQPAFSVSVKAPKGYQVSFEKTRQFIYWLRDQGFNVSGISSDTFQSADLAQQLQSKHFNYKTISVDRVDPSSKVCLPYHHFKNAMYEERIALYYDCDLLTEELLGLEKNESGHIDHPEGGRQGSKDQADAVCGSIWLASMDAEKYAFDYGEMIEMNIENNTDHDVEATQSMNFDFEKELKNTQLFDKEPITNIHGSSLSSDVIDTYLYGSQGMLIW